MAQVQWPDEEEAIGWHQFPVGVLIVLEEGGRAYPGLYASAMFREELIAWERRKESCEEQCCSWRARI